MITRDLRLGDKGDDVRELQVRLNLLGARPPLVEDGLFGPGTRNAVLQAQVRSGQEQTGVADADLYAAVRLTLVTAPAPAAAGDATGPLGAALLEVAEEDLAAGIHEQGHNDGPEIRRLYLNPFGIPPGSNWCAAALWSWASRGAQRIGVALPIPRSPGAKQTMARLDAAGLWIPTARLTPGDIIPGAVVVWDRSVLGKPETDWYGHIGTVRERAGAGGTFATIEGNSGALGDRVAAMVRRLDDPRLLGVGRLDRRP